MIIFCPVHPTSIYTWAFGSIIGSPTQNPIARTGRPHTVVLWLADSAGLRSEGGTVSQAWTLAAEVNRYIVVHIRTSRVNDFQSNVDHPQGRARSLTQTIYFNNPKPGTTPSTQGKENQVGQLSSSWAPILDRSFIRSAQYRKHPSRHFCNLLSAPSITEIDFTRWVLSGLPV